MTFSKPSTPVFSIQVPTPGTINVEFVYNYYVYDESTNPNAGVPEIFKKKPVDQSNFSISDPYTRLPRYNKVSWKPPTHSSSKVKRKHFISENLDKIVSEDSFISSRFASYSFSSFENLEKAYQEINNKKVESGISQAGTIDSYVSGLLSSYFETQDESNISAIQKQIITAVGSLERIADRPDSTLGIEFYSESGKKYENSGFHQLVSEAPLLHMKINSLVLPDVFASASLMKEDILSLNSNYKSGFKDSEAAYSLAIKPIFVGEKATNPENAIGSSSIIGYLVERYELTNDGFKKNKTIAIEDTDVNSYIDFEIKYGVTYYYSVRSIASIEVPGYDDENEEIRNIVYYVSSKPISKSIVCDEKIPPPPPIDLNFIWDYKSRKLRIVWGMPVNPQRDIKQFQIFRRKSALLPFELIKQQCFDNSTKKYVTGESIDGNSTSMTKEDSSFVSYDKSPFMSYIDDDFIINAENLTSSKYIYSVSSIDAHGMISNYSAQFEITFDFFKNKIIKRLISRSGAPRQYPNMHIDIDLFKDVIKTSGPESSRMKIYFMPEYFKISYNSGMIQEVVSTKQRNSFYKLQFINLQNQKSDSLKITVNDPNGLASD